MQRPRLCRFVIVCVRSLLVVLALVLTSITTLARAEAQAPGAAASPEPDLTTPRRAVAAFLDAGRRAEWDQAIRVLDVPASASSARKAKAIEQAGQLHFLLTRKIWIDVDDLEDEPAGKPEDGADTERIGTARGADHDLSITLKLVKADPPRWVFSAATLTRVPELYADAGPTAFEQWMPPALRGSFAGVAAWQWIGLLVSILVGVFVGWAASFLVMRAAGAVAARTAVAWDDDLVAAMRSPARLLLSLFVFRMAARMLALPTPVRSVVIHIFSSLLVVAVAWVVTRLVRVVAASLERRATRDSIDLEEAILKARGVRTQVRVLQRVIGMAVVGIAGAAILMQFEVVRSIGVSLLASAGVAGIVLGLAAQRTIGSVIAGIQLSITQPIRLGDVVFMEGELGTIEEITLTYVVLKVWDERRLVVPMTRFFEQPFQNWTKSSSQIHGTVMLHADWTLPVSALRAELDRILEGNPRWDTRTKSVHVTESKERLMELRVLVSAADSSRLFELRAEVRERLIAWLQTFEGGRYLPRDRELRMAEPPQATEAT